MTPSFEKTADLPRAWYDAYTFFQTQDYLHYEQLKQFLYSWIKSHDIILLVALIVASVVYVIVRMKTAPQRVQTSNLNIVAGIKLRAMAAFQTYSFGLGFFLAISIYTIAITEVYSFVPTIGLSLLLAFLLIDILFFTAGETPSLHNLPRATCKLVNYSSKTLVVLTLAYFTPVYGVDVPDPLLLFLRSAIVLFASIATIILLLAIRAVPTMPRSIKKVTVFATLVLLAVITAEVIGYRLVAHWVFFGTLGTLAYIGVWWVLQNLVRETQKSLETADHPWHQRLAKILRIETEDAQAHVPWVAFLVQTFLLFGVAIGILSVWGLSAKSFAWLENKFFAGFKIGESTIVPLKIIIGIVIFIVLLNIGRSIARRISKGTLLQKKLDHSAIETMTKLTTYIGFMVAAVVGLSLAGFNFQNLAIIAGALSVGIGFGLQNIVNNFISGIILLFERPVRTGDWVAVGGTEGIVKNIRVRSTEIQTWDRTDIIIPNSEFISQQVSNYTLRDPYGRVLIPVKVAYGSNTQLVKTLLEAVAGAHPAVITDSITTNVPKPHVVFREFGDSSLNFELRCFIKDVKERILVMSDIYFEIDKRFRENNVEIPFPQRDLHLRSTVPVPVPDSANTDSP